jgi:hypothetical protein
MGRSILSMMLDKIVQHQRATYTADAGGGRTPTYATINANAPACIAPLAADPVASAAFERQDIVTSHAIYTDSDLAVKAKDRITHGSDEYIVAGSMKFDNSFVANVTVYVIAADLRIP